MYGLSLSVRFTSPTAEEAPAQVAQDASPATSILINQTGLRKPMAARGPARLAIGPEKLPGGL
jgi:hypothetical protein